MFIYNMKFKKNKNDNKKIEKIFIIIISILAIAIIIICGMNLFKAPIKNETASLNTITLNAENYTDFLKDCHEDLQKFIGTSINMTGYVYRMPDFNKDQFVLSRTMILPSTNQGVVVGILCESGEIYNYKDGDWISVSGIIKTGNYHGEMPTVSITNLTKVTAPDDEFVYPPSD